MGRLLIATLYSADAVLVAAHKLSPDRILLLIQDNGDAELKKSLKLIHESIGRVIEIEEHSVPAYDIVRVARTAIELIDAQASTEKIYINITSGRKTMAIGLLLAAYRRSARIRKIAYNPEEQKGSVVYLPKLSFDLNNSQRKLLNYLEHNSGKSIAHIAKEVAISRAMLYTTIKELQNLDLIKVEDGIWLTDAGRIAGL